MNLHDTIVAVATPPGRGGVSIVRVSGPDALTILDKITPTSDDDVVSHKLKLTAFYTPNNELIDQALAVFMKGPNSYTGEDVVEFQCHGGPLIQQKLMDAAIHHGARVADPRARRQLPVTGQAGRFGDTQGPSLCGWHACQHL